MNSHGLTLTPIAIIHSDFKEKFSVPRQPGLVKLISTIELLPPYNREEALVGLSDFSHIWVIFSFHGIKSTSDSLTVRPPRLGGNKRLGVFATRSPYRPNSIGLSLVKIESINGGLISISGGDFLDGTPVFDLKPYLKEIESVPEARSGWTESLSSKKLSVAFDCEVEEELKNIIEEVLAQDPRPRYHEDGYKLYGTKIRNVDIHWVVEEETIIVKEIVSII